MRLAKMLQALINTARPCVAIRALADTHAESAAALIAAVERWRGAAIHAGELPDRRRHQIPVQEDRRRA